MIPSPKKGDDPLQKESFATRLRAVREARHYTLQEMADLLGTSKQVICRYENGQRTPKITVAADYAHRLQVDLLYLLGESDTLQPPQTGQPDSGDPAAVQPIAAGEARRNSGLHSLQAVTALSTASNSCFCAASMICSSAFNSLCSITYPPVGRADHAGKRAVWWENHFVFKVLLVKIADSMEVKLCRIPISNNSLSRTV